MKKIVIIIFVICSFLVTKNNVLAYDYVNNVFGISLIGEKNINNEEEITIDVNVDVSYELKGVLTDIKYDETKLEFKKCESTKFTCTYNGDKLLLDSIEGVEGNKNIAKLTFNILNNFKKGDTTTISLKNVEGSDNTRGNKYDFKIHKLQDDNTLKSLSIPNETLTPAFSPDITNYKIVTYSSTINIEATSLSKISNIGKKELNYGNNIFEIVVTSETNAKKTYVLNVFREKGKTITDEKSKNESSTMNVNKEKNNNKALTQTLSSNKKLVYLKIDDTDFVFDEKVYEYSIHLKKNIKELKIDYKLEDSKSKVVISGDTSLSQKENKIVISVIAEDGSQQDYVINISKDTDKSVKILDNQNKKQLETKTEKNNKTKNKNIIMGKYIIYCFVPLILVIIIILIAKKIHDKKI